MEIKYRNVRRVRKILSNERYLILLVLILLLITQILTYQIWIMKDANISNSINNHDTRGLNGVKIDGNADSFNTARFFWNYALEYFEALYNFTLNSNQLADLVKFQFQVMILNVEFMDNNTGIYKSTHLIIVENDVFQKEISSRYNITSSFLFLSDNIKSQDSSFLHFKSSESGNYSDQHTVTYANNRKIIGSIFDPILDLLPDDYLITTMDKLETLDSFWTNNQFIIKAYIHSSFNLDAVDPNDLRKTSDKFKELTSDKLIFSSSRTSQVEGKIIENTSIILEMIYEDYLYIVLSLVLLFSLPIVFLIFAYYIVLSKLYQSVTFELKILNLLSSTDFQSKYYLLSYTAIFSTFILFNFIFAKMIYLILNWKNPYLLSIPMIVILGLTGIYTLNAFVKRKLKFLSRILYITFMISLLLITGLLGFLNDFQSLLQGENSSEDRIILYSQALDMVFILSFFIIAVYLFHVMLFQLSMQISKRKKLRSTSRLTLRYFSRLGSNISIIIPGLMIISFLTSLTFVTLVFYADYHEVQAKFVTGSDIYWNYDNETVINDLILQGLDIQSFTSVTIKVINTLNHGVLNLFIINNPSEFYSLIYKPPDWAIHYDWSSAENMIMQNKILIDPEFNSYISDDSLFLQYLKNDSINSVDISVGFEVEEFPVFLYKSQPRSNYFIISEEAFNIYFTEEIVISEDHFLLINVDKNDIEEVVEVIRNRYGGTITSYLEILSSLSPIFLIILQDISLQIFPLYLIIFLIWIFIVLLSSVKGFIDDMVTLRRRLIIKTRFAVNLVISVMMISVIAPLFFGSLLGFTVIATIQSQFLIHQEILNPPDFKYGFAFAFTFISLFSLNIIIALLHGHFISKKINTEINQRRDTK